MELCAFLPSPTPGLGHHCGPHFGLDTASLETSPVKVVFLRKNIFPKGVVLDRKDRKPALLPALWVSLKDMDSIESGGHILFESELDFDSAVSGLVYPYWGWDSWLNHTDTQRIQRLLHTGILATGTEIMWETDSTLWVSIL